jgi:hypothetical protein
MMSALWKSPIYNLRASTGTKVTIDVTTSISAGLPPSKVLTEKVIPFFLSLGIGRILDFGAGALRHTLPLLAAGFDVYAVEFESGLQRATSASALTQARSFPNFTSLVWPHDFIKNTARFDAILLCYVLQTMPVPSERLRLLKLLKKKLKSESYVLYMSRYNQVPPGISSKQKVSDGYFMYPKRNEHSFYREFSTQDTHNMFDARGLHYVKSLSERGTDQMYLYGKGPAAWV